MPPPAPLIRRLLVTVLQFQRQRAFLEEKSQPRATILARILETNIENVWKQMSRLQTFTREGTQPDFDYPGYVNVNATASPAQPIYFPFHLVPATPEGAILREVLALARQVGLNRVQGHDTALCLSGSTVILKDVLRVGDIDFCEYVPAEVPASALAQAFRDQVVSADTRYCAVSIRSKGPNEGADELKYCQIKHNRPFSEEQLNLLCKLVSRGRNVKTTHVVQTIFAGVTETSNWVIIFQPPLEQDPISRLSFAHQEAALGIFARRPLHTLEALAAYLNFLRNEIQDHAETNPVKALKRAIPWLRLFGHEDLRLELLQVAQSFDALQCAAVLAKAKILSAYQGMNDMRPELSALLDVLREEIEEEGRDITQGKGDLETLLNERIRNFGQSLIGAGHSTPAKPSLLQRILSLAE